jgi:hypothetical protein
MTRTANGTSQRVSNRSITKMSRTTGWAATAGVAAAAAGTVAGELVAGLFSPSVSPITGVGGAIIDLVPPWLKDWAIAVFGTADKIALVVGIGLVIAVLAAVAGILEHRRGAVGMTLMVVAGIVGLTAVLTRAQSSYAAALAPIVAVGLSMLLLRLFMRRLGEWNPDNPAASKLPARRGFLRLMAGSALAVGVGGAITALVRRGASAVAAYRDNLALPRPESPAAPVPDGAAVDIDGMPDLVTSNRDFYRIDTALTVPTLDPADWKLKVTGMVDREIEIDFGTLLSKPMTERHITSNPV